MFSVAAEVARMVFPVEFTRKRPIDLDEYSCNISNPITYKRPKFSEEYDLSRRYDTSFPQGFQVQTWGNSIEGPPFTRIDPNHDFARTVPPEFQHPSPVFLSRYDVVSSQFNVPGRDLLKRYDAASSHFQNPSRDFSRRYDEVSPRFQNPSHDHSRKCESNSHRFQARRNENPKKGPIMKKNLTRDFSRGSDSGSSRFQARSKVPKEGPISKMTPTSHISRKCSKKRKAAKMNQTRDFSRKSDSVSLRFQTKTCEKPKDGSVAKVNRTHDISRKCDSVSAQFQAGNSEKPKGGLIAKMNPTRDISRKCDSVSSRFRARASENPKDRSIVKVNLTRDVLRKCDSISPQFQERTSEKPKEKSVAKVNPTSDLSRKCEYVSPQSLTETGENLKEGLIVEVNSTHDFARKCDADSPRVEVKASENSKEGSVKKVNPTNDSSRKCVAISLPVEAKTSEIPDQAKPSAVLVTGVTKFGPTKSTVSRDKFKIQKVNAVRDFPKHCGALAPQITIASSGKNLVIINEDSLKASNISSFGLPKSQNTASKVEKDNIEGIKPGLKVDDVEVVLSELKVDDLENVSNEPVLSNGVEKVLNEVISLSGVPKSENTTTKAVNYNIEGIIPGLKVHDVEEAANELKVNDVKKVFSEPILQNGAEKMLDEVISSSGVPKSEKTMSKVVNGNIEGNKPGLKVDDMEDVANELEVDDMEKVFIQPMLPSGAEEVSSEVILSNDVEKVLNMPISTNAPEENFARAESVDSKSRPLGNGFSVIQDCSKKCSILKDHAFDRMDDVASIGEQSQSGGLFEGFKAENVLKEKLCEVLPECAQVSANKSLECEDEEDRLEKGNSPIYPSGIDSSFFEKHHKGVCSEYDVDVNDTASLYNSDLWPNQDKVEPVRQSSKERSICPFLDADAENHKNFNDLSVVPFGECEALGRRKHVKEAIDSYGWILAKLLEDNEAAESSGKGKVSKQVHIEAAMLLKKEKQWVNTEQVLGHVPGIEVGDRFRFRAELVCIGLHRLFQNGIDYMRGKDGKILATSIVSSGRYANDAEFPDVLRYSGQGGNATNGSSKKRHDQKLVRGNLALKNSMEAKTPVRVIRKNMNSVLKYYYDGLYVVTKVTQERSQYGKLVYMFQLNRIALLERLPYLVEDISQGKEKIPINVVNTVDDEKFPFFNYIAHMIYPESCNRSMSGCDCTDGCSEPKKCLCVSKNGGEFPFSDNGTIIVRPKSKRFIYECGPSCKCPTSCKNRVSQYGIRYQLEVFKTESMGWGVRSCNYIPAGSFICEYVGELLQDLEAEQRTRNDEYLFDIDNDGFTIDAAKYGNVGRFINHSCSPNLYAQNVLYDHDNKRMPHVMFFAVNGIFPFQELTYDYNYKVDQVRDGDGNIKKKACHCGSRCCRGRLY